MTPYSASSTPRPLPHKRGNPDKRSTLALASAAPIRTKVTGRSGQAPRKTLQTNEGPSDDRQATAARIDALREDIRQLVDIVARRADVELLDLMRDEMGSYSQHKAAQDARTWAAAAGVQLETGLMMLNRAMRPEQTEG